MHKTVEVSELGRRAGEMLDEVAREGAEYVVARDGRPEAALISYTELARLREIERREQQLDESWERTRERMAASSADYSEDELETDIEAARREIWEARPGRRSWVRAVVDTNIVVRAVLKPFGTVGPVVDRLEAGEYALVYTGDLLAEFTEVLDRPRIRDRSGLTAAYRARVLAMIVERGERVAVARRIRACRDPKDDMVLEAAVAGQADVIVSGDEDLLVLSPFGKHPNR